MCLSDAATAAQVAKGVRASVVRLAPLVHDRDQCGFLHLYLEAARQQGEVLYVGDGHHRWPAVHQLDAAYLFRLALEQGQAGASFHGVAEEACRARVDVRELMAAGGERPHAAAAGLASRAANAAGRPGAGPLLHRAGSVAHRTAQPGLPQ